MREAAPAAFEALISATIPLFKAAVLICAITGFLYLAEFFITRKPPESSPRPPLSGVYMNIVLDDSRLVRCRTIDRTQPSCTLISDCDDDVDRCVVTFEILRRLPGPADHLPLDAAD
jgi:hypothetical protein